MDYYESRGDEIVVHLDYEEPEPSLYRSSRTRNRPTLPREYSSTIRSSGQGLKTRINRGVPRLQEHSYEDDMVYDYDEYDQRDDAVAYSNSASRLNIQDQRTSPGPRQMSMGSSKSSVKSTQQRIGSKDSVAGKKSKIDLTRRDSDSSFELFATLIVGHITPKMKDGVYTLGKSDMSYFDAIIPQSLRHPFVEAVRTRNDRIRATGTNGVSNLDTITKKCEEIGLGLDMNNNFLLGGGEKLTAGRVRVKVVNTAANATEEQLEQRNTALPSVATPEENSLPRTGDPIKNPNSTTFHSPSEANNRINSNINVSSSHLSPKVASTSHGNDTEVEEAYKYKKLNDEPHGPAAKEGSDGNVGDLEWLSKTGLGEEEMAVIRLAMTSQAPNEKAQNASKSIATSHTSEISGSMKGRDEKRVAPRKKLKIEIPMSKREKRSRTKNKRKKKSIISAAISVHSTHIGDGSVVAFVDEWRDGLWDIFGHGICHPAATISIFAPLFALGQVMTRLKLNWIGSPATQVETDEIYLKLGTLVVCWLSANILAAVSFQYRYMLGVLGTIEIFAMVMINMFMFTFSVFATGNTRSYLRQVYNIQDVPGTDYLLAAVYMPLTIAQMLRHTADYNQLEAYMFTATGLFDGSDFDFIRPVSSYGSYSTAHFNDETSIVSSLA